MQTFNKEQQLKVKVYFATEKNKLKFQNENYVFESIDERFLVVYTKEDMEHHEHLFDWWISNHVYHDFMFSGVEGQMYYNMLINAEVVNFIPGEYLMHNGKAPDEATIVRVEQKYHIAYYFINENEDMTNGQYSLVYLSESKRISDGELSYLYLTRKEQ